MVLGLGLAVTPMLGGTTQAQDSHPEGPASLPPQPGDHFAFLAGPRKGQIVKVDDLALGGPQSQVYPVDPASGLVRNGSRLNLIVLARFDPSTIAAPTRERAADGVVAYSGVCTHQGCPVNMWSSDQGVLFCSCHGSMFDPKDAAQVVGGPAPRPLPSLPLKVDQGMPVVAEAFSAHVGPTQSHS
jgi:Rieske Fe-S protein